MSRPKVILFFDIRSGFTYLVFNVLRGSTVFKNVDIEYVPVDLRSLWQACNNQGAWPVKNKPAWIVKSAGMWAKKFGIPMAGPPDGFPNLSTTNLQQALCIIAQDYPEQLSTVMHALFDAFWVRSEPVHETTTFGQIFEEHLGVTQGQVILEKV